MNDEPGKNDRRDLPTDKRKEAVTIARVAICAVILFAVLALIDWRYVNEHSERIRFITVNSLSLLILIAVVVQAYIYHGQWGLMRQTVEMSRVGERAYIGITGLSMDGLIEGASPTLFIKWCNAGKTPAWHFYACPLLLFGEKGKPKPEGPSYYMKRDVKGIETGFVGAGREVTVSYRMSDLRVTTEIIEAVESGREQLFVSVYALYVDVYGERRLFDAQVAYEPETHGFTDCYNDY